MTGFTFDSAAGTLSVPSRFVLQRPLNPALITKIQFQGIAGSTIIDTFNTHTENDSCGIEILERCDESGFGMLGYGKWNNFYIQLEGLGRISSEEGSAKSTKIKNRRDQQHYLAMAATTWKNVSLGAMVQYNQFEFRKRQSFHGGSIENGGDETEWSLSLGGTVQFWNYYYFSLYREDVLIKNIQDIHGRKMTQKPFLGFYGLGVGGAYNEFTNWKFAGELYQLILDNTFERNELIGGQLDISWKNIVAYASFIIDTQENYFERSGDEEASKYAFGVALYGEQYQVQFGRDTRFFDNLDGGVKLTVGYQF